MERAIVRAFNEKNIRAKRTAPLQTFIGNDDPDLIVEGIGKVEVKIRARGFSPLYQWLNGSEALVIRQDRQKPLIVFELEDFLGRGWL